LAANVSGIHIEQLKVKHPGADDDGLWFINIKGQKEEVQIESSEGEETDSGSPLGSVGYMPVYGTDP
jgi:hypothetical protein